MEDLTMQEILKDIERELTDPSIIQDNKLPFKYNDEWYRIRMPNQWEEAKAQDEKNTLFGKLIQTEGYYMKKRLKQILKEKQGVDLDALEEEKYKINIRIQDYQLVLAKKYDEEIKTIEEIKQKISDLSARRIEISIEIGKYLSASIDDQIEKAYIQAVAAFCTEKVEIINGKEEWVKVWPNLKAFQDDSSLIINKVLSFTTYLLLNLRAY
jgi:hypothetical protein